MVQEDDGPQNKDENVSPNPSSWPPLSQNLPARFLGFIKSNIHIFG